MCRLLLKQGHRRVWRAKQDGEEIAGQQDHVQSFNFNLIATLYSNTLGDTPRVAARISTIFLKNLKVGTNVIASQHSTANNTLHT
jgi:hypothetical protein